MNMRIFLTKTSFLIFPLLLFFSAGFAQENSLNIGRDPKIKVAIHSQPPYIIQGKNDTWDGISIQLWREVAESLQLQYQLVNVPEEEQQSALQNGKIDVALLANVSAEKDTLLDFSYFYHTSHLGIAMMQSNNLRDIASAFFSKRFWKIALMLSVLLLIVGTAIYLIERTSNDDNFGGERSIIRGIGAGFWWAGVTMTTIGYGDKAPVTFFGRAVALLWMLIAMGVTSVLTASIISAMGGSYSKTLSIPDDLRDMKVAAVEDSDAATYLKEENVSYQSYPSLKEALQAVENKQLEVAVSSVALLKYTIDNSQNITLKIQPQKRNPQYYALGIREEHDLLEDINREVIRVIKTDQWQQQLERYMPEKAAK
ncbi:polar amino acid transport system substrate-binding protein [Catalinimonas alkaloidigena]|uniref:transporter substrate-binding domain-containing protein n=1 Tax=Catalinimonas alkaloidigena TaxID=1075417 RepID=UPI002406E4D2|nr:transporter substrate-binding domain-containing protein [Catalinimonas alkaloidigena]MDF9795058.1 polar amino acid transport system substrate-binding protein [Catalinimonas alkaloidigena]